MKDFHRLAQTDTILFSVTKNAIKSGFSFYWNSPWIPANVYCVNVNLKNPKGRKVLFSKYNRP